MAKKIVRDQRERTNPRDLQKHRADLFEIKSADLRRSKRERGDEFIEGGRRKEAKREKKKLHLGSEYL